MRTTNMSLEECYAHASLPPAFVWSQNAPVSIVEGSLYLTGVHGSGKTTYAVAAAKKALDESYEYDDRLAVHRVANVKFVTSIGLLNAYKATYSDGVKMTEDEVTKRFASCDMLIVDDLGKEAPTEWAVSKLFEIVNARYEKSRPIIVTSQYSLVDLASRLSKNGDETACAIVSRLSEMCRVLNFGTTDHRMHG